MEFVNISHFFNVTFKLRLLGVIGGKDECVVFTKLTSSTNLQFTFRLTVEIIFFKQNLHLRNTAWQKK